MIHDGVSGFASAQDAASRRLAAALMVAACGLSAGVGGARADTAAESATADPEVLQGITVTARKRDESLASYTDNSVALLNGGYGTESSRPAYSLVNLRFGVNHRESEVSLNVRRVRRDPVCRVLRHERFRT